MFSIRGKYPILIVATALTKPNETTEKYLQMNAEHSSVGSHMCYKRHQETVRSSRQLSYLEEYQQEPMNEKKFSRIAPSADVTRTNLTNSSLTNDIEDEKECDSDGVAALFKYNSRSLNVRKTSPKTSVRCGLQPIVADIENQISPKQSMSSDELSSPEARLVLVRLDHSHLEGTPLTSTPAQPLQICTLQIQIPSSASSFSSSSCFSGRCTPTSSIPSPVIDYDRRYPRKILEEPKPRDVGDLIVSTWKSFFGTQLEAAVARVSPEFSSHRLPSFSDCEMAISHECIAGSEDMAIPSCGELAFDIQRSEIHCLAASLRFCDP